MTYTNLLRKSRQLWKLLLTDVRQLRSFKALLIITADLFLMCSSILSPLKAQLCKGKQWRWRAEYVAAFREAKVRPRVLSRLLTGHPGVGE